MNNFALSEIQASSLSALGGISTITAIVLGVVINREIIHWYQLVGAVLILIGACGVNMLSARNKQE